MEELDWQPRETAPKTGEQLLVKDCFVTPSIIPDYSVVRWNGEAFAGMCNGQHVSPSRKGWEDYLEPFFTHWYPLEKQKAHPQSRG